MISRSEDNSNQLNYKYGIRSLPGNIETTELTKECSAKRGFGQNCHFLKISFSQGSQRRSPWISELSWSIEEIKIVLGSQDPLPSASISITPPQ